MSEVQEGGGNEDIQDDPEERRVIYAALDSFE